MSVTELTTDEFRVLRAVANPRFIAPTTGGLLFDLEVGAAPEAMKGAGSLGNGLVLEALAAAESRAPKCSELLRRESWLELVAQLSQILRRVSCAAPTRGLPVEPL